MSQLSSLVRSLVYVDLDRVTGLEKVNAQVRDRVKMLLAKSDTDDRLIDALRCEIQVSDCVCP